jgi:drug/metabolite transporter (DMT)-like permease
MKTANNSTVQSIESEAVTSSTTATNEGLSGFTLAMFANVLWGTSFLASKYTLQAWGPFTASALRFAVALVVMAAAFPFAGFKIQIPKTRTELASLLTVGLSGFGLLYPLQLSGLALISSGLSAAIMLTSPLFVIALGAVLLKESVSLRKVLALALGLLGGCVLIFSGGNSVFKTGSNVALGSLLTVVASLSLAFSVIATRKASAHMHSANITFWSMLFGLLLISPFSIRELANGGSFNPSALSILSLLYLSIVCSAICFMIWNRAIARSTPKELATTMHIKTPAAVVLGVMIAGETLSLAMIIGTAIVGFGVWLSQSKQVRKQ